MLENYSKVVSSEYQADQTAARLYEDVLGRLPGHKYSNLAMDEQAVAPGRKAFLQEYEPIRRPSQPRLEEELRRQIEKLKPTLPEA